MLISAPTIEHTLVHVHVLERARVLCVLRSGRHEDVRAEPRRDGPNAQARRRGAAAGVRGRMAEKRRTPVFASTKGPSLIEIS